MFDLKLFYLFNNLSGKSEIFDWFAIFFADYFGYFLAVFFLAILFLAPFYKDKLKVFLTVAISVVLSRFVITEIIRFLYCRPRPFVAFTANQLVGEANCSFPSGHAAFFFALAMAIYFYNKKWGVWFFVAATLISVSRIVAGVHYPTDILVGAVIGIFNAYIVFRYSNLLDKFIIKK
ncbi:MAG: phosphatase PAP2 family protein [Parcubacteria group bacterium]|nr:phosphatase PAP2 family protein [Parcubacteria group bacterium]